MSNHEQIFEFSVLLDKFLRENSTFMQRGELGRKLILFGASIFHDACKDDGIKFTEEMIMIKNTISNGIELGGMIPYKYEQPKDI